MSPTMGVGNVICCGARKAAGTPMKKVEAFRWKFYDAMLRKERLSTLHMTREEAGQRLPGAVADLTTREVRYVPEDRDDFRPSALDRTH